ncbi:MAG: serine/threonine-protein kinase [Myxococcota bacterium]
MSNTQHQQLPAGARIEDRYIIEGVYGVGGFATVYRATEEASDAHPDGRPVAIKLLHADLDDATIEESVQRFLREARAISSIAHPGVVNVYDVGRLADRFPYIVMEPLDGRDLSKALDEDGPIPPSRLLPMFIVCLDALAEAHAKGIVHRDLKPENLILSLNGASLKIIDFGIVRLDRDNVTLTRTGRRVGTPRYLAPEYIKDGTVTPQIDVYQMGLSLIEGMTGRRVVTARNPLDAALAHIAGDLNIPRGLLDGPLGPVLHSALSLKPRGRYAEAGAFANALRQIDPASVVVGNPKDRVCLRDHEPPVAVGKPLGGRAEVATTMRVLDDEARSAIAAAAALRAAQAAAQAEDGPSDTTVMEHASTTMMEHAPTTMMEDAPTAMMDGQLAPKGMEHAPTTMMEDAPTAMMDGQLAPKGMEDAPTTMMEDAPTTMMDGQPGDPAQRSDGATLMMDAEEVGAQGSAGMGRAATMASLDATRQQLDAADLQELSRKKTQPLPRLSPEASRSTAPHRSVAATPESSKPPKDQSILILMVVGGTLVLGALVLFVLLIVLSAPEDTSPHTGGAQPAPSTTLDAAQEEGDVSTVDSGP